MFRALGRRLGIHRLLEQQDPGRRLVQAARAAGAALLVTDCACCRQSMGWGRYGACEACWEEVSHERSPGCSNCGKRIPLPIPGAGTRCGVCDLDAAPFTSVASYGSYAGRLREMVHALKYHGRTRLGRPLGSLMAAGLIAAGVPSG